MSDPRVTDHGESDRGGDARPDGTSMFVDGLLAARFQTTMERERRIERVMKVIDGEHAAGHGASVSVGEAKPAAAAHSDGSPIWRLHRTQRARLRLRFYRRGGALLATAALVGLMFILAPRSVEAGAQARAVAAAERQQRDRRVLFQLFPPSDRSQRQPLMGTLDIRDARHLVLSLRQPNGFIEVRGRDGDRFWKIGPGPELINLPHDMPWPAWIQSPRGGLLVDMAEALEQGLGDGWKWSRIGDDASGADAASGAGSKPTVHLIATRDGVNPGEPNAIDLRLDPSTGLATRIEMAWPPRPPHDDGAAGDHPPPPDAPAEADMARDGAPRGMPGDRPPPGGVAGGDGLPPPQGSGMNGDRPPHDRQQTVPMGPPSRMILIVEPPITYDASWFKPETQIALQKVDPHAK
jgi:hypothetical protein